MLNREDLDSKTVRWTGSLNGVECRFTTTNKDLILTERAVNSGHQIGVELVDQNGLVWSRSFRNR